MELVIRSTALALCAVFAALLLKRSEPALVLPLIAAAAAVIALASLSFLHGVRELADTVRTSFALTDTYTLPLLKCLAVALITRFGADLCRDASQNAAAGAVELSGAACALGLILPLLSGILKLIGGLL